MFLCFSHELADLTAVRNGLQYNDAPKIGDVELQVDHADRCCLHCKRNIRITPM